MKTFFILMFIAGTAHLSLSAMHGYEPPKILNENRIKTSDFDAGSYMHVLIVDYMPEYELAIEGLSPLLDPNIILNPPEGCFNSVDIYLNCGPTKSFTVSATNLTADLVIEWEDFYGYAEFSLSPEDGYDTYLSLPQTGGVVNNTTIYVRNCMVNTSEPQAVLNIYSEGISINYAVADQMIAGDAPISVIPDVLATPNSTITVPVFVSAYEFVSFADYTIEFDPLVLEIQDIVTNVPNLIMWSANQDEGRVSFLFGATSDNCFTYPDNEKLLDMVFNYIGGSSSLIFTNCSFQKMYYLMPNDEPVENFYHDGFVGPALPPVLTITPNQTGQCGNYIGVCPPQTYTISGENLGTEAVVVSLEPIYGYADFSIDGVYHPILNIMPIAGSVNADMHVRNYWYPLNGTAMVSVMCKGAGTYIPVTTSPCPTVNAPATTIGNVLSTPSSLVTVPITVSGFNGIQYSSYTIEYDPDVLVYQSVEIFITNEVTVTSSEAGTLIISFTVPTCDQSINLPDNSLLYNLEFMYNGGSTLINITDAGFENIWNSTTINNPAFADGNIENLRQSLNFVQSSEFYCPGYVGPFANTLITKLFLQSLYDPANNQMKKAHNETGDAFAGAVAEKIKVKLLLSDYPFQLVYTEENVELYKNGMLYLPLPDTVPEAPYYVAISGRNILESWSALPIAINTAGQSYDFTQASCKVYGDNQLNANGKYCFYAGDVNQDGVVDTDDMTLIDNDAQAFMSGYLITDVNGDGMIDTEDMTVVDNNNGRFVASLGPTSLTTPILETKALTGVMQTTATCGGLLTSQGNASVSSYGVCWSATPLPDITSNHSTDGFGTADYNSYLNLLEPGSTYYVRAYAINANGVYYGQEISFETQLFSPGDTVSDIDGNQYSTIIIGSQNWMAENLKASNYANGECIPEIIENSQWNGLGSGAMCWYNNSVGYENPYGRLYNYFAVTDSRGLCPEEMIIPDNIEWTSLITHFGGDEIAGGSMKGPNPAYWASPNSGALNTSGFTGAAGGTRHQNGSFSFNGKQGYWWSDDDNYYQVAWGLNLGFNNTSAAMYLFSWNDGKSVRCMKQLSAPALSTTEVSEYNSNSAVCLGSISNNGGAPVLQRGFCWSMTPSPTLENNQTATAPGTGTYSQVIYGLMSNTTYYVRSFAINDPGVAYGSEVSFTTTP